jgi:hypothetical protein
MKWIIAVVVAAAAAIGTLYYRAQPKKRKHT